MTGSVVSEFERLVQASPTDRVHEVVDTACVLGGSIAGLLAARVLSDRARRVVVLESDNLSAGTESRPGAPQDQQVHTLLPAGQRWLERWMPGITVPAEGTTLINGVPQAPGGEGYHLLAIGRPVLETLIRDRVTSRPNVSVVHGRATGLQYRDDAVSAVQYVATANGDHCSRTCIHRPSGCAPRSTAPPPTAPESGRDRGTDARHSDARQRDGGPAA